MLKVTYSSRLGLRMFQYAFGRILAERIGYAFFAPPLWGFAGTDSQIEGERVMEPQVVWIGNHPRQSPGDRVLSSEDLKQDPESQVTLGGPFQRYEFYHDHQESIREDWFRVDRKLPARSADDLLICVAKLRDCALGRDQVVQLERDTKSKNVQVLVDDPNEARNWRRWGYNAVAASPFERLRLMLSFQRIAISQDPLHWWGAFLGKAREVYFPPRDRGHWGSTEAVDGPFDPPYFGIDLRVADTRYLYDRVK